MSILGSVRKFALLSMLALAAHALAGSTPGGPPLSCHKAGNLCLGGCTTCTNHVRYCCQNVTGCCSVPCLICTVCEPRRISC